MSKRLSTRERRERLISSLDDYEHYALIKVIARCTRRHGHSWFTDEQIDEITSDMAREMLLQKRFRLQSQRSAA